MERSKKTVFLHRYNQTVSTALLKQTHKIITNHFNSANYFNNHFAKVATDNQSSIQVCKKI